MLVILKKYGRLPSLFFFVSLFLMGSGNVNADDNGTFTGLVLDVAEKPVAGVEIFVYDTANTRRPADFISSPTSRTGEFRITLPSGTYFMVARLRHGKERFGPLQPGDKHSGAPLEVDIGPGENVEEEFIVADLEETSRLAVKVDSSFLKIEGLLVNKNGEPVKDAYIFVNKSPALKKIPDYVSAWTDDSGRYTIFLPVGTYYFAAKDTFPPGQESVDFTKVMIDRSEKNINIVIDK